MSMEKSQVSPQLARLLSAAAGWALSGDIAGKVDPHLAQEWDRASSHRDKKELQEEMMRQMHRMHKKPQAKLLVIHRKSDDGNFLADNSAFRKLSMFYKEEDDIFARARQQEEEDTVPYDDDDFDEEAAGMPKARYNAIESNDAAHYYAGEAGWGGEEHDEEDFHPETGELQVPGKNANDVRDWAKGVQEQYGVPLVGGPTGNEPHDDIYQHYGIEGGHMSQKPITAQHIADYVQNKTGHPVSMPGTQTPTVPGAQKPPVPGTQAPTTPGIMKDHAPIPPRYGLQWDAVKHRWTRPEKIGRTVWEVQGHKRFRGTGTGAHERGRRAGGSGGYGVGSSEAGRRFRSVGDVGRVHPHEAKQPGQKELHRFGKVKKLPRMGMKRR